MGAVTDNVRYKSVAQFSRDYNGSSVNRPLVPIRFFDQSLCLASIITQCANAIRLAVRKLLQLGLTALSASTVYHL